tara:strand:+ start:5050 stop:5589 length:540 start_codon:yes stop_codon:yes gene_type:complete
MKKIDKEQLEVIKEGWGGETTEADFLAFLKEKGLLEEEFEIGWYDVSDDKVQCLVYYDGQDKGMTRCGILNNVWNDGVWSYSKKALERDGARKATDKEVEGALIEEAKRRGFNGVCKIVDYSYTTPNCFYYKSEFNSLFMGERDKSPNIAVFSDGKWAEIIEGQPKKEINVDGVIYVKK